MNTRKLKLTIPEIVIYSICAAFILWGLTYVILGLLAENLPLPNANNALYNANLAIKSAFGLGFLGWGLILTGVFAMVAAITMMVYAKNVDKEYEKQQRRAARLSVAESNSTEENK